MESNLTWILVANASTAKLFAMHKARVLNAHVPQKDLLLIREFSHEASRKKGMELTTDKMGDFGSGTFVEATSPKAQEAEVFAHELAHYLEKQRKDHKYRELILIAPPAFMGLLNKNIAPETQKFVSHTIEKDYTKLDDRQLQIHLVNFL